FATPPAGKREEFRRRDGDRPSRLGHGPQGFAERGVLSFRQASIALPVLVALDSANRVIGPQLALARVGEDRAESPHRARVGAATAGDPRQAVLAGLDPGLRLALRD